MFGGDDTILKNPELKIRAISIFLDVDGKELRIYMELGKNEMIVSGDADGIEKGKYTAGKGSQKTPPINILWLHLMGIDMDIDKPIKIYQYIGGGRQALKIRTFVHTFLINESRLGERDSILKNGEGYSKNIPVSTITSLIMATLKSSLRAWGSGLT